MMPTRRNAHYLPYLTAWRGKKFLTQVELGAKSGISATTIQYLEDANKPHPANPSTVRKLAEALGIEPDTLVNVDPAALATAGKSTENLQ